MGDRERPQRPHRDGPRVAPVRDRRPAQLPGAPRLGPAPLPLGAGAGAARTGALEPRPARMTPRGILSLTFDNLGEAAEIELGAISPDAELGGHPTAIRALPALLGELDARG